MKMTETLRKHIGGLFKGQEVCDPTPLAVELGIEPEDPIELRIQKFFASERMKNHAEQAGFETIDESNDFFVGGEDEIVTPYEAVMMIDESPTPLDRDWETKNF